MSKLDLIKMAFTRPDELKAMISYKVWRDPLNSITQDPQASGWDREQMKICWKFLDLTSRSFAAVIKELKGELSRIICLFYLVLRALDTIEDDMTIPIEKKVPLLVNFHKILYQKGWNFKESGPNEKDRQLLVEFDKVIEEFHLLGSGYQTVIADITAKMGGGMATYIESSASEAHVERWAEYDLYCHFVAGLVGEGLSRLFSESNLERPWLGAQLDLSNHMGLFLQKTNIIRDYAEDVEEGRHFWPRECWGKPISEGGPGFETQKDVCRGIKETSKGSGKFEPVGEDGERGMQVLSTMLLDAISHSTKALDYLTMLKEQSVFNFCAIPQVMAIATLDAMVCNPNVLRKNVKIRKGQAVKLILHSVNPRDVSSMFRDFARSIHRKIPATDANFTKWSIELSAIEVWCESHYPSFVQAVQGSTSDVRTEAMKRWAAQRKELAIIKRRSADAGAVARANQAAAQGDFRSNMTPEEREEMDARDRKEMMTFFIIIMLGLTLFMGLVVFLSWYVMWYLTQDTTDPFSLQITNAVQGFKAMMLGLVAKSANLVRGGASKIEL